MRLGQTSIVYFISKILGSALGFFATVFIVRTLGEEIYGYYSLTLAVVLWVAIGGKIGITSAVTKRVSEGTDREEFVTAGFLMGATMFGVITITVLLFHERINSYVGAPVAEFVVLLVFVDLLRGFTNAALKGHHLVHIYAPLSTAKIGIRSLAQIILVFVGFSLGGILMGYAVGGMLVGIVGLWVLKFRPSLPRKRHFVSLFDYAKFSWLGSMRGRVFNSIDIIVLGAFVSAGLVGIYAVAWSIAKFLDIFGNAISTTLFPEMSNLSAENDPSVISHLVEDALAFAGLFLIPGVVGGAIVADRLLLIYGEGIVRGGVVLVILIFALLIYTYTKQLLNTLNAVDRPDLAFRANGIFIISNIVLNILFIWHFGWVGAAIATAVSAAIGLVSAFYYADKLVPFELPKNEFGYQWGSALIMGMIVYTTRQAAEAHWAWIPDYNAVFVVLLVGLGGTIYFSIYLAVSSTFRAIVLQNLPFKVPFVQR